MCVCVCVCVCVCMCVHCGNIDCYVTSCVCCVTMSVWKGNQDSHAYTVYNILCNYLIRLLEEVNSTGQHERSSVAFVYKLTALQSVVFSYRQPSFLIQETTIEVYTCTVEWFVLIVLQRQLPQINTSAHHQIVLQH